MSYDQWKTASPYDDDFSDLCPRCGANYNDKLMPEFSDEDQEQEWYDEGFCSSECFAEGDDYDGLNIPRHKRITKDQEEYLSKLEERAYTAIDKARENVKISPITIDSIFEGTPDGDFNWDDLEAGDWRVYSCGERDCPIGWHKVAYGMNISRKNDKKCIELWDVDSDGNRDFEHGWESGEDPHDILYTLSIQSSEYFYGWFQYWSECARTGEDVLGEADNPSIETFIKFAEDDLKYLES